MKWNTKKKFFFSTTLVVPISHFLPQVSILCRTRKKKKETNDAVSLLGKPTAIELKKMTRHFGSWID